MWSQALKSLIDPELTAQQEARAQAHKVTLVTAFGAAFGAAMRGAPPQQDRNGPARHQREWDYEDDDLTTPEGSGGFDASRRSGGSGGYK